MAIDTLGANALASNSVTTAKIAADAVTSAKIPAGAVVASDVADGSVTTAKLADNAVNSAKALNLGRRNKLMNGDAKVAQRATTAAETSAFVLDRWKIDAAAQDQLATQVTQSSDTPDGMGFSNSHLININTAETAVDSNEYLRYYQTIEAQNLQDAAYGSSSPKKMQLTFWVKATGTNVTGTYGILFWIQDANKYQNATYTISSANTWEKKTIEIGTTGHGAITNDNGIGLRVNFFLMAGSQYTSGGGYTNQWGTAAGAAANSHYAVGHAMNSFVQTVNNKWYITGLQLEVGDAPTDFEQLSFAEELTQCQRYLYQITEASASTPVHLVGYNQAGGACRVGLHQQMRTAPSVTTSNMQIIHGSGTTVNITSIDSQKSQGGLTGFRANPASSITAGDAMAFYTNGTNAYIRFDSEL